MAVSREQAVADQVCMTPGPCDDCGEPFQSYMATDEVWRSTGLPDYGALLCLRCLRGRVERDLTSADFIDAPVNEWIKRPAVLPTIDQVRRAARRMYNGHWSDSQQILVFDRPNPVRHEQDVPGTWIDVSVFVPDEDALREDR